jgi:hypothetical protein
VQSYNFGPITANAGAQIPHPMQMIGSMHAFRPHPHSMGPLSILRMKQGGFMSPLTLMALLNWYKHNG